MIAGLTDRTTGMVIKEHIADYDVDCHLQPSTTNQPPDRRDRLRNSAAPARDMTGTTSPHKAETSLKRLASAPGWHAALNCGLPNTTRRHPLGRPGNASLRSARMSAHVSLPTSTVSQPGRVAVGNGQKEMVLVLLPQRQRLTAADKGAGTAFAALGVGSTPLRSLPTSSSRPHSSHMYISPTAIP